LNLVIDRFDFAFLGVFTIVFATIGTILSWRYLSRQSEDYIEMKKKWRGLSIEDVVFAVNRLGIDRSPN